MSNPYAIKTVSALEILDSRGNPTVKVSVHLAGGAVGHAGVPAGASVGSHEAVDLRDNDKRYGGKGVLRAVGHVNNELHNLLSGWDATEQSVLDAEICRADGTDTKSRLGANAVLGVSLAVAHAVANQKQTPLYNHLADLYGTESMSMPVPMMNILNGGAHASNNIDIQEVMIQPTGAPNFCEALRWGAEIYHALRSWLKQHSCTVAVGDEGGFAPDLSSNEASLEAVVAAIEQAGFVPGEQVFLTLDCAATEFFSDNHYHLAGEGVQYDAEAFATYLAKLCSNFPVSSVEDGMAENDWVGWKLLGERLPDTTQLVGDDLFATRLSRLERGINEGIANAILIKPNQIGTLSETLEVMKRARQAGYSTVVSHRSGETEDTTIADLAVGTGASQIKTGAPCRSDRVAKYNRLLTIEAHAKELIPYNGNGADPDMQESI